MNEPFPSLVAFLDACHADVEGRSAQVLPAELRPLMQALAVGKLSAPTRDELVQTLKQNPQWVADLATEAKRLRDPARPDAQPAP